MLKFWIFAPYQMNLSLFVFMIIILLGQKNDCEGKEILGLFAHPGKSHFDVFERLMKELATRGHNVTVVSFFPQKENVTNYKDISLQGLMPVYLNIVPFDSFEKYKNFLWISPYINFFVLQNMGLEACEKVLPSKQIKDLLNSEKKFDLAITEIFNTDCFLGLIHKLQTPYIGISSCTYMPWFHGRFSNPNNPAYQPNVFYGSSQEMDLPQRLHNAFIDFFTRALYYPLFQRPAQTLVKKYIGDVPPLNVLAKNASMLFINTHFTVHKPRALMPNIVEVGGIHIKPAQDLPQEIEKFISESEHGVILFSLGSMLKADTLDTDRKNAFLNAFREIPQRVIWKFEKELENLPKNVKTFPWLPQRDILNHTNVKAFIAHGGLLGLTEAIYCGKPILGIPMFGDQHININYAVEMGIAIQLPYQEITKEKVLKGIHDVLDYRYYERSLEVSKQFRDRPMSALELAVFWTDYILRHNGAAHLQSSSTELEGYQYYLLDIWLLVAFILSITYYQFIKFLKT